MQGRCAMAAALQGGLRMRCGGGGGQGTEGAVGRCLEAQRGPTSLDEGMGHGAMKLWGYGAMGLWGYGAMGLWGLPHAGEQAWRRQQRVSTGR